MPDQTRDLPRMPKLNHSSEMPAILSLHVTYITLLSITMLFNVKYINIIITFIYIYMAINILILQNINYIIIDNYIYIISCSMLKHVLQNILTLVER